MFQLALGNPAMCFVAILHKAVPDFPVVVAANRDGGYDRPGSAGTRSGQSIAREQSNVSSSMWAWT